MKRFLVATAATLAFSGSAGAITFTNPGGYVWTPTQSGLYEIVAIGAAGGDTSGSVYFGGTGALVGGRFSLNAGTQLDIVVGREGRRSFINAFEDGPYGGAGGGGTFVFYSLGALGYDPLVVAGGGGGASPWQNGWNANTGQAGLDADGLPLTSINLGGPSPDGYYSGAGGGALGGSGDDSLAGAIGGAFLGYSDYSAGCSVPELVGRGGSGSEGGGGGGCIGGGGGGGYSGGSGGRADSLDYGTGGGGGGSYNADTLTGWSQAGVGTGHGSLTITLLQAYTAPEVSTPEPASAALALMGLFGLAAIRRRR